MSSVEFSNEFTQHSPDRLEATAGLLQEVSTLISEIKLDAEQSVHKYTFPVLPEHQMIFPESVASVMPDMDSLAVTIGTDGAPDRTYISFDFYSDSHLLTVSRSGAHLEGDEEPDDELITLDKNKRLVSDESEDDFFSRVKKINRIPASELNVLLFSLMYPDSERGYSMVESVDFHNLGAYDTLRESLKLAALDTEEVGSYEFSTGNTVFNFTQHNNEPTTFYIRHIDDRTGNVISAHSDLETNFTIRFFLHDDSGMVSYSPEAAEISRITAALSDEIERIAPSLSLEQTDTEAISTISPESTVIDQGKTIHSRVHVQNVLDQLSFDPTDPSA
jgi:hypothetical protein